MTKKKRKKKKERKKKRANTGFTIKAVSGKGSRYNFTWIIWPCCCRPRSVYNLQSQQKGAQIFRCLVLRIERITQLCLNNPTMLLHSGSSPDGLPRIHDKKCDVQLHCSVCWSVISLLFPLPLSLSLFLSNQPWFHSSNHRMCVKSSFLICGNSSKWLNSIWI